MIENVIAHLEQVTNEWLTTVLRRSGALTQGTVHATRTRYETPAWRSIIEHGAQGGVSVKLSYLL